MQLRVPYTQDFIRVGRRKSEPVYFWSEGPVLMRKIGTKEAPPAAHEDP